MARRNRTRFVAGKMSSSTCFAVALGWGYFITSEGKGHGVPRCGALSSQLVFIQLGTWRGLKERSPSLVTVLWFQDYFSITRGLSTSHEHLGTQGGGGEEKTGLSPLYCTEMDSGPRLTVREVLQTKGRIPHLN